MDLTPIESECLQATAHDAEANIMQIQFASGDIYEYFNVPPEIHAGLREAPSAGRFFRENVRGQFAYRKL